jgi:branched-chain amino acid transport system ATP-binding protein
MTQIDRDGEVCKAGTARSGEIRLAVEDVSTYYGEAQALGGISIEVREQEVVAILGSNGAGKTTLLRTITGLIEPRSGRILFRKEPIAGLPAHKVVRKGVSAVPEGRELFGSMSVRDNLLMGTYSLSRAERAEVLERQLAAVYGLFPILKQRSRQRADTMSGGQQQMLAVARALMANPRLLVLDEPSLGLSPLLVSEMMHALRRICSEMAVSLLLVEQNARAALRIADYVYVLERGQIVLAGTCEEVASSPTIQAAYLGGERCPPCGP